MFNINTLLQALYYFEDPIKHTIKIKHNSIMTSILIGAGLFHSVNIEKKPYYVPIILVFPSIYAGYNVTKFVYNQNKYNNDN
jgi:hypothetical protein